MEHALLKEKVLQIVEHADNHFLEMVVGLAEVEADNSNLMKESEEDIVELQKRSELRRSGVSKTYSWDEAKAIITANVKNVV